MAYKRKDAWYQKAKQEGYRSRAAYKLMELHRKHKLFRRGMRVVDLGCAPGGWLQVAAREVGGGGRVVGMDRLEVEPVGDRTVTVLLGDIGDDDALTRLESSLGGKADLVLSDMAPDTSGVGFADHHRSIELVRMAARMAAAMLKPGGSLLAKVFDGPDVKELADELRRAYGKVTRIRPGTTRKGSRELYLLASEFKGQGP